MVGGCRRRPVAYRRTLRRWYATAPKPRAPSRKLITSANSGVDPLRPEESLDEAVGGAVVIRPGVAVTPPTASDGAFVGIGVAVTPSTATATTV
jgi:hypothetical protein